MISTFSSWKVCVHVHANAMEHLEKCITWIESSLDGITSTKRASTVNSETWTGAY